MTVKPGDYSRKVHNGWYDTKLVCEKCERLFSDGDNLAYKVLVNQDWTKLHMFGTPPDTLYDLGEIDQNLLHRFVVNLLWRSGASSRKEFENVQIEEHLDILAQVILARRELHENEYRYIIERFDVDTHEDFKKVNIAYFILNPTTLVFGGYRAVRFFLGLFRITVFLGSPPLEEYLRGLSMPASARPVVLAADGTNCGEAHRVEKILLKEFQRLKNKYSD